MIGVFPSIHFVLPIVVCFQCQPHSAKSLMQSDAKTILNVYMVKSILFGPCRNLIDLNVCDAHVSVSVKLFVWCEKLLFFSNLYCLGCQQQISLLKFVWNRPKFEGRNHVICWDEKFVVTIYHDNVIMENLNLEKQIVTKNLVPFDQNVGIIIFRMFFLFHMKFDNVLKILWIHAYVNLCCDFSAYKFLLSFFAILKFKLINFKIWLDSYNLKFWP